MPLCYSKFRHFPYLFSLEEVVMEDTTMCTFMMLKEYEPGIHLWVAVNHNSII